LAHQSRRLLLAMLTILEQYEATSFGRLTVVQPIQFSMTMRGSAWLDHVQLHVLRHDDLDILPKAAGLTASGVGHARKLIWSHSEEVKRERIRGCQHASLLLPRLGF